MILSTTPNLEGHPIQQYLGIVTGEAILGANFLRDFLAGMRDIIGGRAGAYESTLRRAKDIALQEMADRASRLGANAVIGIDLDYEVLGKEEGMLLVTASGTAVLVAKAG
jgi:uncharacterized protein YbjQ (UPF0145 family)